MLLHPTVTLNPSVSFYYIQYNLPYQHTNQCFIKPLHEETFTKLSCLLVCQDTYYGQRSLLFPFFLLFSLCFLVPTCCILLVWAAEWAPVFALSLSCGLWSVWTAWPKEAVRRGEPVVIWVRAKETGHNSIVKALSQTQACNKHQVHIYADQMKIWHIRHM